MSWPVDDADDDDDDIRVLAAVAAPAAVPARLHACNAKRRRCDNVRLRTSQHYTAVMIAIILGTACGLCEDNVRVSQY